MKARDSESSIGALIKKLTTPRRTDGPFEITDPVVHDDPDPHGTTTYVMPEDEAIRRAARAIAEDPADGDEYERITAQQIEQERQNRADQERQSRR